jgi:hypothetical protein
LLPFGSESFVIPPAVQECKIYKTIILPVVLYGCETWSLTLREEHRLTVFENGVLRRIFGHKRDGVTGEWRKLHNEELHNLYSSPGIIRQVKSRRMRLAGPVARMGEERKVYKVLVRSPKERDHLEDQGLGGKMGSEWILLLGRLACGERSYSSYSFPTSSLDGGEWSASRLGRALAPGKGPPVPIVQEAGWAPEPV